MKSYFQRATGVARSVKALACRSEVALRRGSTPPTLPSFGGVKGLYACFRNRQGMSSQKLILKVGAIVMLIRNTNMGSGLVNGIRMKVHGLIEKSVKLEIITAAGKGNIVCARSCVFACFPHKTNTRRTLACGHHPRNPINSDGHLHSQKLQVRVSRVRRHRGKQDGQMCLHYPTAVDRMDYSGLSTSEWITCLKINANLAAVRVPGPFGRIPGADMDARRLKPLPRPATIIMDTWNILGGEKGGSFFRPRYKNLELRFCGRELRKSVSDHGNCDLRSTPPTLPSFGGVKGLYACFRNRQEPHNPLETDCNSTQKVPGS
ncbi:hypothetical protein ANN_10630 [Periplaneta americana]|uniref:DNA helicase Pif1-like 2B domain-containing protein n=1 Tax=Periplaneta americana TaxID=6978 RepID=A0ABQ8T2T0_PERAM|nr:hypothetical protein ANN_10630 [Periplaneta americana]